MTDLDALGNMIHDGLDMMLQDGIRRRVGYVISSRELLCGYGSAASAFYHSAPGKPWRGRSVQAVVDELQELGDRFQIRHFIFQDDNFFGPGRAGQERACQVATEILHRGLDIKYFVCCRLNDIKADTLQLMQTSGLSGIGVSVESTSQESLDLLGKDSMQRPSTQLSSFWKTCNCRARSI
jgi:hypothetical protein